MQSAGAQRPMLAASPIVLVLFRLALSGGYPCDASLPPEGRCDGEKRVRYCEDGQPRVLDCTGGAVCAWNDSIGAFDCVAAPCKRSLGEEKGDQDVPAAGLCTEAGVVWCDAGRIKELECKADSSCGWNAKLGQYDCISEMLRADIDADADAAGSDTGGGADTGIIPSATGDTAIGPIAYAEEPAEDVGAAAAPASGAGCSDAPGGARVDSSWRAAMLAGAVLLAMRLVRRRFRA